jgi:hypothetical protein
MSRYTTSFKIETSFKTIDFYHFLRKEFSFLQYGEIDEKWGPMTKPNDESCFVYFYNQTKDKSSLNWINDFFGFIPKIEINIELNKHNGLGQTVGLKHTVEIINFLINNLEGNAVVEENYRWVLSRKNGIIELDPRHSLWKPEHLAMFTFPYKIVELPQP